MRCRNYVKGANGKKNIVWFGSIGKDINGNSIKADNIVDGVEGLVSHLNQSLSVLEGELWWNMNEGIPLVEKYRSKGIMDSYILGVIDRYNEITGIKNFESTLTGNKYECDIIIESIYGDINIKM